jgi:hypothetical protein
MYVARALTVPLLLASLLTAAAAEAEPVEPARPAAGACVPGRQLACGCPGGRTGTQVCLADGSGYAACDQCEASSSDTQGLAASAADRASGRAKLNASDTDSDIYRAAIRDRWAQRSRFGLYGAAGAAIDNAALAFSLGGLYRAGRSWLVGLDAEYNPWFSLDTKRFRRGAFNIYATVVKRFPITETVSLRTTGHLGASVLLFDVIGAPAGSIGPYLGISFLGLEYEMSKGLYLILNPADVAFPVPHLTGAPLSYRQYRFTIGVQFGA